ncbi:MAG TPA: hypothetical protein VFS35_06500 [Terrimicrobiaceae bacterium]|nr:hypothetical protein [Terrimicrobiaceae bacterium]
MKIASIDNPVRADWFHEQGLRLDATPYLSGALEARKRLEALPNTVRLDRVTTGIFHAGRFSRRWVDNPEHGVPFFSSTDVLEADYSYLPYIARSAAEKFPRLLIEPGWTLVTRSGTVGRIAYARPDVDGFACSEHVMRVVPDESEIRPGYLNTFLRSRFGVPMIVASAYGAIIQHIEPNHLIDLPVPRFSSSLEQRIHDLVEESAQLRAASQTGLVTATEDFFRAVGLPELIDYRWHDEGRDLGFDVNPSPSSLRAMNYAGRALRLKQAMASVPHLTLGEICRNGRLGNGPMFKRIDSDLGHGGVLLVGQRQGWWNRPEDGRVISRAQTPADCFVADETVMVGAQGLPSEGGLLGRGMMVTGRWLPHAYSQHFLRIGSGRADIPGAYLFALFRSEVSMRIFRSMLAGSGPQSLHTTLVASYPIPIAAESDRQRIAGTVRQAFRDRDRADVVEDEALALLTQAIEGAER